MTLHRAITNVVPADNLDTNSKRKQYPITKNV